MMNPEPEEVEDRSKDLVSATTTTSAVPGLVPVDPDPGRFRQARIILAAEAIVLIVLGVWAVIAAGLAHTAAPDGAAVLVFRFTMIHALAILATGVLAAIAMSNRRFALAFSVVQTVAYLFVFIISAGNLNSFSDTADSILHGALAALGLVLVMWIAARALDGTHWIRRPARTRSRQRTH